jgi:hypothetical protein
MKGEGPAMKRENGPRWQCSRTKAELCALLQACGLNLQELSNYPIVDASQLGLWFHDGGSMKRKDHVGGGAGRTFTGAKGS